MTEWYECQLIAVLLSVLAAFVAAALVVVWSLHYDRFKSNLERHESHYAGLAALIPDLEVMLRIIEQAHESYTPEKGDEKISCPSSKLDFAFFEQTRSSLMRHPRAAILNKEFPLIHSHLRTTRDTMDRFEDLFLAYQSVGTVAASDLETERKAVIVAVNATLEQLPRFIALTKEQLAHEATDRSTLWSLQ